MRKLFWPAGLLLAISVVHVLLTRLDPDGTDDHREDEVGVRAVELLVGEIRSMGPQLMREASEAGAANARGGVPLNAAWVAMAERRLSLLGELIRTDPEGALQAALSERELADLPSEARPYFENWVEGIGHLDARISCDFDNRGRHSGDVIQYTFQLGGRRYEAYLYGRREDMASSDGIFLRGVAVDDGLAAWESSLPIVEIEPTGAVVASGMGGAARFQDLRSYVEAELKSNALEVAEYRHSVLANGQKTVRQVLFAHAKFAGREFRELAHSDVPLQLAETDAFLHDNSRNKVGIQYTVAPGVIEVELTLDAYKESSATLSTRVRAALREQGSYDPDAYDHLIIYHPHMDELGFAGRASLKGTDVWLNGYYDWPLLTHELGHNLGLGHARRWIADDRQRPFGSGELEEYGNEFDVMGDGDDRHDHFSSIAKNRLGWLGPTEALRTSREGEYRVFETDTPAARGLQLVEIPGMPGGKSLFFSFPYFENASGLACYWNENGLGTGTAQVDPWMMSGYDGRVIPFSEALHAQAVELVATVSGFGSDAGRDFKDVYLHFGDITGNRPPQGRIADDGEITPFEEEVLTAELSDADGDRIFWAFVGPPEDDVSRLDLQRTIFYNPKRPPQLEGVAFDTRGGRSAIFADGLNIREPEEAFSRVELDGSVTSYAAGNDTFVQAREKQGGHDHVRFFVSSDGAVWRSVAVSVANVEAMPRLTVDPQLVFAQGRFWALVGGVKMVSFDGQSWSALDTDLPRQPYSSMDYLGDRFVVVGEDDDIMYQSFDGVDYSPLTSESFSPRFAEELEGVGALFFGREQYGLAALGEKELTLSAYHDSRAISIRASSASFGGRTYLFDTRGWISTTDGRNWEPVQFSFSSESGPFSHMTYYKGKYYAYSGSEREIYSSSDLQTWDAVFIDERPRQGQVAIGFHHGNGMLVLITGGERFAFGSRSRQAPKIEADWGQALAEGEMTELTVTVTSGELAQVEFSVDHLPVWRDEKAPFTFSFTPPSDRSYRLGAIGFSSEGMASNEVSSTQVAQRRESISGISLPEGYGSPVAMARGHGLLIFKASENSTGETKLFGWSLKERAAAPLEPDLASGSLDKLSIDFVEDRFFLQLMETEGRVLTSVDGAQWTEVAFSLPFPEDTRRLEIYKGPAGYIAWDRGRTLVASESGDHFSEPLSLGELGDGEALGLVARPEAGYLYANAGGLYRSTDLQTWEASRSPPLGEEFAQMSFWIHKGGVLVKSLTESGTRSVLFSVDGLHWQGPDWKLPAPMSHYAFLDSFGRVGRASLAFDMISLGDLLSYDGKSWIPYERGWLPPEWLLATSAGAAEGYSVAVWPAGAGAVRVEVDPEFGSLVHLEAMPSDGWRFKEWLGGLAGVSSSLTTLAKDGRDLTAVFELAGFEGEYVGRLREAGAKGRFVLRSDGNGKLWLSGADSFHGLQASRMEYALSPDGFFEYDTSSVSSGQADPSFEGSYGQISSDGSFSLYMPEIGEYIAGNRLGDSGEFVAYSGRYELDMTNSFGASARLSLYGSGQALLEVEQLDGGVDVGLGQLEPAGELTLLTNGGGLFDLDADGLATASLGEFAYPDWHGRLEKMDLSPTLSDRLKNISTRAELGENDEVVIGGFVVRGIEPVEMLVRVAGPALAKQGIARFHPDPSLELWRRVRGSPAKLFASNDDWDSGGRGDALESLFAEVGAAPFDRGSKDAAFSGMLDAGVYTVVGSRGDPSAEGIGLVEVYERLEGDPQSAMRLKNISTRGRVGRDDQSMIAGFYLRGQKPRLVLLRALGPTLQLQGVEDVVADPRMELRRKGAFVASNDDWGHGRVMAELIENAGDQVAASPMLEDSRDAALLLWLKPGLYTAVVTVATGQPGIGLVEVYELTEGM